jgi:uncharacterized membrane protein
MPDALPLHPALVHFPVAATVLAAGAALAAAVRPRTELREWLDRTSFLLGSAVASTPAAIVSGRAWSRSLGLWAAPSWLPPAAVEDGLLRRHVLAAVLTMALASCALLLSLFARRGRLPLWPVVLVVSSSAAAACLTAHVGGGMVFGTHG